VRVIRFYKPTPTIDLISGADDHLIGIAIHGDEALRLLDLLHQISDGHALVSTGGLEDRAQRCSNILPEAGWRQLSSDPRRLIDQALSGREVDKLIDQQSLEPDLGRRKQLVWAIERKLAEVGARPIIFTTATGPAGSPMSRG
jgi:hypothetical protein